jgi:iron-sulfur cluster insertion protein
MSIIIDESAVKRIEELRTQQSKPNLMLRVTVEGGGCSGFQYILGLTEETGDKDQIFAETVVTDDISIPFLENATIKFKKELAGSEFVIENPNAKSGCGCGTSFSM